MAESDGKRRAFVVWDSTAQGGVKLNLDGLRRRPPEGFDEVIVLGLDRKGTGAIWRSNVEPSIRTSEVAVALIDLPNANVGFEIGFALGLAGSGDENVKTKRVRLASVGGTVPEWLKQAPFKGQLVATASRRTQLVDLITESSSMEIPTRPNRGGETLLLCPIEGPGEEIGGYLEGFELGWRRPKTEGWEIRELAKVLDGIGRVVWVILPFAGPEQRDGAENAAAAAIAGYALAHGVELHAWQHSEARDVLDVGVHGHTWSTHEELETLVLDLADDAAPGAPRDVLGLHRAALRKIHRDLVPFFAHVDRPLGDVFVELMLDLRPGMDEDDAAGMMAKLARRELPNGLPTTPTLPELLAAEPSAALSGRYVVLGEPGAGKSTLCRHLCFALAKDEDGPVPIFASLARLARDGAKSVFDLAEEDAAFHFDAERAAGLSARLRERAESGGAWLFLDGLDEVSGETARSRVREVIAAFAADERIARVVVTSREVGYERLDERFVHAKVRPLSGDGSDQQKLLVCWLDDRAADVWRRIAESPRVTELAQNPLLLTLLAKIAVDDDKLPPSRAKLYARAVRLLLKRGHGRDECGVSDVFAAEEILAPLSLRLHASGEDAWSEEEVNGALRTLLTENAKVREALDACRQTPMQFLDEVATRSGLLGAYRGPGEPWRYMHRSLREFLAAKVLVGEPEDQRLRFLSSIVQPGEFDSETDEEPEVVFSRWGETYALLVGLLPNDEARTNLIGRLRDNGHGLVLRILPQVEGMAPSAGWAELTTTDEWDGDHLLRMVRGWRFDGHDEDEIRTLLWTASEQTPDLHRLACVHYALATASIPFDEERFFAESGLPPRPEPGWIDSVRLPPNGRDRDTFWMGSREGVGDDDEHPRHRVSLAAFELGKTTVTEAQYAAFDPSRDRERREAYPVVEVSWWDARLFCRWAGGSLPTEAQWESACRAGSETKWCFGDREKTLAKYAWFGEALAENAHPVRKKLANKFGLYDMHGNVWEWCADWFGPYPEDSPDAAADVAADPAGAPSGSGRVYRGGSFWGDADDARSAYRGGRRPGFRNHFVGFRVAFPAPRPRSR